MVKSLDVARLLSSESLESGTPALTTKSSQAQAELTTIPTVKGQGKPGAWRLGPGPSSPQLPDLEQLLGELQCQLILPQAFLGGNPVQEARDAIVGTLISAAVCLTLPWCSGAASHTCQVSPTSCLLNSVSFVCSFSCPSCFFPSVPGTPEAKDDIFLDQQS